MPEFSFICVSEVAVNPVIVQKVTWVILSLTPALLCTCQFSEATSFLQDKIPSPSSELTWPIVPVCWEETGIDPRKSTGAEGQDVCGSLASQNLGRGGLGCFRSLTGTLERGMHHPAKFVSVEGEDLLKEACLMWLDAHGCCIWSWRHLEAFWQVGTTRSLPWGGRGGASPVWIFIRDPEKAQGRVSLRQSWLPLFLISLKMLSLSACLSFCCFLSKSTKSLSLAGAIS